LNKVARLKPGASPLKAIVFLGVAMAGAAAPGCRPKPANTFQAAGTIEMTEIYLSPSVSGKVNTLTVHEGDRVRAGDQIATLNRFQEAKKDLDRAKRLLSGGGSTQEQVEKAELAWEDQQLVAPVDAVVLQRVSEPGEVVSPGVPVVVLGNPQDLWMKVFIPESEIGRLRLGQAATIRIDAFPQRAFEGRVTYISPKAEFTPKNIQTKEERVTQMFAVKISMARPDGSLKPGLPADAEFRPVLQ
jgi:multidrug resistance efflux pump